MAIFKYIFLNFSMIMKLLSQHVFIVFVSLAISVLIGISLGIFVTRGRKNLFKKSIITMSGFLQSVPSIGVIALIFVYTGIGARTAIISLAIYSIVPVFFNTSSALFSVPGDLKEYAKGMGMTDREILFRIEIPLSVRSIFAGIRTATTINIGTATVATVIGAGGLGELIFIGLRVLKPEMIFSGALFVSLLAIFSDFLLSRLQNRVTSKGLKIKI
jgi:osmoprotectant transport system permease protein